MRPNLISELLTAQYRVDQGGSRLGGLWVPAHVGVKGMEAVDVAANWSLPREEVDVGIVGGRGKGEDGVIAQCKIMLGEGTWGIPGEDR